MSRTVLRHSLAALLLLAACRGKEPVSGPIPQGAYVWQRNWTPEVRESVRQARDFASLVVLAAEVDLRAQPPRVARIPLDAAALKEYGKPVGAAVRASTFPFRFEDEPRIVQILENAIRGVAAEARDKGIALAEIQIDYDCPEAKLQDYRWLLPRLKKAAAPVPLTMTALPDWTRQRQAFRNLVGEADGYVLQLHSLKPPEIADQDILLIQERPARVWVEEAARFGFPFRVALPTYGYSAVYNTRGRLVGLLAEGPLLSDSRTVVVHQARSDPAIIAGLVRGWTRERPPEMAGILWFRLPVEVDRRNWSWPTLRAVMAGQVPQGEVRAALRHPEPGLVELDLLNAGKAEAPWPSLVRIRWKDDTLLAADGLAGYHVQQEESAREIRLERPASRASLRPGERRVVAWLRFKVPTEVHVELPPPAG